MGRYAAESHPVHGDFANTDEGDVDEIASISPLDPEAEQAYYEPAPIQAPTQSKTNRFLFGDKSRPRSPKQSHSNGPTSTSLFRVRITAAILWGLLAFAAIGGLRSLIAPTNVNAKIDEETLVPGSIGPEGFANRYLNTYLSRFDSKRTELLQQMFPDYQAVADEESARMYVISQYTISVSALDQPHTWSVYMGADLIEYPVVRDTDGKVKLDTSGNPQLGAARYLNEPRFYMVVVAKVAVGDGFTYVATGYPTQTAAPRIPKDGPRVDISPYTSPPSAAQKGAIDNFLREYLTPGSDDFSRYICRTCGSEVRRITPSPYKKIEVLDAGLVDATPNRALTSVMVKAYDDTNSVQVLQYTLQIVLDTNKQWRIEKVSPGPLPLTVQNKS